jgi:hypothetical protein
LSAAAAGASRPGQTTHISRSRIERGACITLSLE